jgi:hypothetical protein
MHYDTVYKAEYMLTSPEEHPPVTAPPGGHIYGHILLDKFKLYCIYSALLNNKAGHYHGHF